MWVNWVQAAVLGLAAIAVLSVTPIPVHGWLSLPAVMKVWGGLVGHGATQGQSAGGSGIPALVWMLLIPTVIVIAVVLGAVWLVRRRARL